MSKIKVTIEEHISETFEVEADTIEEAMQIAEARYWKGEYILGCDTAFVTARLMSADDGKGDCTEWVEF